VVLPLYASGSITCDCFLLAGCEVYKKGSVPGENALADPVLIHFGLEYSSRVSRVPVLRVLSQGSSSARAGVVGGLAGRSDSSAVWPWSGGRDLHTPNFSYELEETVPQW